MVPERFHIDFTECHRRRSLSNDTMLSSKFSEKNEGDLLVESKSFNGKGVAYKLMIVDQYGPELAAFSEELGVTSGICGYIAPPLAVLADRPFCLTIDEFHAMMHELHDVDVLAPGIKHIAAHVRADDWFGLLYEFF